jgi:glycerophosphoryl diester phosphodiesterase
MEPPNSSTPSNTLRAGAAWHRASACATAAILFLSLLVSGCTLLSHDLHGDSACPNDPSYGMPAPILFAHRGGAREAPESTAMAFQYAIDAGADVLELDVRLTRDGELVVWHGPSLDNVRIKGQNDCPCQRQLRKIGEYYWSELAGQAWVADPPFVIAPACAEGACRVAGVPEDPQRNLMGLEEFLRRFPDHALNVEIKDFFAGPAAIARFAETIEKAETGRENSVPDEFMGRPHRRTLMVASANDLVLLEFRRRTSGRYSTNIAPVEAVLPAPIFPLLWFKPGRALQVPPWRLASGSWPVSNLHRAGAAVHVFITKFPFTPGLDEQPGQITPHEIDDLLERGVDGIMTDRPCEVRPLIDQWMDRRQCNVPKRSSTCREVLAKRRAIPPPEICSCPGDGFQR